MNTKVDRRTFIIVVIIVAIALPIIVIVFRKSFFPLLISLKNVLISTAALNSLTGLPAWMADQFK